MSSTSPRSGGGSPEAVLRRLDLTINRRLDGLLQGEYLGLVPGQGSDLGETRAYQLGDDVRHIDWNVTARLREPYVRETIADRELETWVLVDLSPSLEFGTAWCSKRELATSAAAATGFLTARTGNRLGAVISRPEGMTTIPARGGREHLMALLARVVGAPPAETGSTDLAAGVFRLGAITRRRGLVVIVSDFLGPDDWEQPLRQLAHRHETLCIEVVDPRELELPAVGVVSLTDPRSGEVMEVQTSDRGLRERYAAAAAAQRQRIADIIRGATAEHLRLRTDRDWLLDLVRHVGQRRQRAHARSTQTAG